MAFQYAAEGNQRNENPLIDSVGLQQILDASAERHKATRDRLQAQITVLDNKIQVVDELFQAFQNSDSAAIDRLDDAIGSFIRYPESTGNQNVADTGGQGQVLASNGVGGTTWKTLPSRNLSSLTVTNASENGPQIATIQAEWEGEQAATMPIYAPESIKNPNALTIQIDDETSIVYDGSTQSVADLRPLMNDVIKISRDQEAYEEQIGKTESALLLNFNGGNMTFDGTTQISVRVYDTRIIVPATKRVNGVTVSAWQATNVEDVYYQTISEQRNSNGTTSPLDPKLDANTRFFVDIDLLDNSGLNPLPKSQIQDMLEDYALIQRVESLGTSADSGILKFWCYNGAPEHDIAVRIRWIRMEQEVE